MKIFFNPRILFSALCLCMFPFTGIRAQTESHGQFWNEFAFNRTIGKGWSLEGNLGQTWTESNGGHMFESFAQWYAREWLHFYPTARWKTSFFIGYYSNYEISELGQVDNNEWRWALQGVYYFNKIRYTLNSRTRVENRSFSDSGDFRQGAFRFRQQIKFEKPLGGSKAVRAGVYYLILSDEVMFRTNGSFFDRNRITAGAGYALTDNFQIEITYANEYLPRTETDEMYHAFQVNFVFNNIIDQIESRFKSLRKTNESDIKED